MGYLLRRELADALPAGLTPGERLVALEVADQCHDSSREGYGPDLLEIVARRTGLADVKQVRRTLTRLAARGIELRVHLGTDGRGRAVVAYRGTQTKYRVPTLGKDPSPEALSASKGPPLGGPLLEKGPLSGSQRASEANRKGLSPEAPTAVPQAPQLASRAERSSKQPDTVDRALLEHGFPAADRTNLEAYLLERGKGAGVVVRAARDGNLPALLEDYRRWAAPTNTPPNFSSNGRSDPALPLECDGCSSGWAGEDETGRPVPCPACRPHIGSR